MGSQQIPPVTTGAGSGDVTGPSGATNLNIAVFNGTTGKVIKDGGQTIASIGTPAASSVLMGEIGSATYDDVQDWSNNTQSAGVISGGVITDGGSGTINISAIKGIVKTTNSDIGANVNFDMASDMLLSLTDNSTNYIAVDYNSGTPQHVIGTTNTANGHTIFNLGKVYREGTSIDIIDSGLNIYDLGKRIQQHHIEESALHFVSGAIVGETGTRNISISAGVMYSGLNRIATDAIDTSGTDDFEYYYYTGSAWVETDETDIDNLQYNNIASGLATLANNRYGIHWTYKGTNGTTYVVYGQSSYTLLGAQSAQPPASIPAHVSGFGVLRAKIIILKSATAFTEIESVEDTQFTSSTPSNHNELANLDGGTADEYYHLTSAEYSALGNFTNWKTWTGAARTSDGVITSTTNLDAGTVVRYKATAGSYVYGMIESISTNAHTIIGAACTTAYDDVFEYSETIKIKQETFVMSGAWGDTASTTLLADYNYKYQLQGHGFILGLKATVKTEDTGANEPRLNVLIGSDAVLTANTNEGIEPLTSVVNSGVGLDITKYDYVHNEMLTFSTDANGTENDSLELTAIILYIEV